MNTQLPLNQRIDRTKLEKHPSGDGWLVPMRNGRKAHVLYFTRKGYEWPILGLNEYGQIRAWCPNGKLYYDEENDCDLMLDAYVKPDWTLGRSVNGFTLQDGQEWHSTDFLESDLPSGTRPRIKGEGSAADFECRFKAPNCHWGKWKEGGSFKSEDNFLFRTRRPLPPVKKMVPLGPEDVPPGSVVRSLKSVCPKPWISVLNVNSQGIEILGNGGMGYELPFTVLFDEEWQISRDGGKTWQKCEKEEAK